MTFISLKERKLEIAITAILAVLTIAGSIFASALSVQGSLKDEIADNKLVHEQINSRLTSVEKTAEYLSKRDNVYHDLMIEFRINLKRICTQLNVKYEQIVEDSKLTKNN